MITNAAPIMYLSTLQVAPTTILTSETPQIEVGEVQKS
jgi:hypothetical protein